MGVFIFLIILCRTFAVILSNSGSHAPAAPAKPAFIDPSTITMPKLTEEEIKAHLPNGYRSAVQKAQQDHGASLYEQALKAAGEQQQFLLRLAAENGCVETIRYLCCDAEMGSHESAYWSYQGFLHRDSLCTCDLGFYYEQNGRKSDAERYYQMALDGGYSDAATYLKYLWH